MSYFVTVVILDLQYCCLLDLWLATTAL